MKVWGLEDGDRVWESHVGASRSVRGGRFVAGIPGRVFGPGRGGEGSAWGGHIAPLFEGKIGLREETA